MAVNAFLLSLTLSVCLFIELRFEMSNKCFKLHESAISVHFESVLFSAFRSSSSSSPSERIRTGNFRVRCEHEQQIEINLHKIVVVVVVMAAVVVACKCWQIMLFVAIKLQEAETIWTARPRALRPIKDKSQ